MYSNYVYNAKPSEVRFIARSSPPAQSTWPVWKPTQFITLHYSASPHTSRHLVALLYTLSKFLQQFWVIAQPCKISLGAQIHTKTCRTSFCTFQDKWSYDHCHIMTKLRLPCDMIGCEICCGRSHAGDHTLSCTGQGGLGGPGVLNKCSKLSHPLPFPWLLKKYTLNTYNCPMSRSPATRMCHMLPLSHRPCEWLGCTYQPH